MDGILKASPSALMVGLSIMEALPEEIEKVDMSRGQREDLQEKLREVTGHVTQVGATTTTTPAAAMQLFLLFHLWPY